MVVQVARVYLLSYFAFLDVGVIIANVVFKFFFCIVNLSKLLLLWSIKFKTFFAKMSRHLFIHIKKRKKKQRVGGENVR